MARMKYINSKLKQKDRKKEQKQSETINQMASFQEKYCRTSNKIFNICRLRIIESTQEEQNNERFI